MELADYARLLKRDWAILLVCTIVGLTLAVGYLIVTPPKYVASASVLIAVQPNEDASAEDLAQATNVVRQAIPTLVRTASSDLVLDEAGKILDGRPTAAKLRDGVRVSAPTGTNIIDISVTRDSPDDSIETVAAIEQELRAVIQDQLGAAIDGGSKLFAVSSLHSNPVVAAPVGINPMVALSTGGFAGLLVGLGIAVVRALRDTRIRNVNQAESSAHAPVLGVLHAAGRAPLSEGELNAARAHAIRRVRANVLAQIERTAGRRVAVSSAAGTPVQPPFCVDFAESLSACGLRVVLVDCDLSNASLTSHLGLTGAPGLSEVLEGRTSIEDVVVSLPELSTRLVPSGSFSGHPSEMLSSAGTREAIDLLSERYDLVVVNAPAILGNGHGAVVGRLVDGVILLVEVGETEQSDLSDAARAIGDSRGQLLGSIAFGLPRRGPDSHEYGRPAAAVWPDDEISAPAVARDPSEREPHVG